ncbi:hypothetical protein ZIOFF_037729 [Zingiber officinale]|uniref:Uncharacterized protein n=1 Tax=Zingiber officinale TaxID=94328 RepID=A0A8J5KZP9_ZINOF|nr:hypothetical protein ZIOFF_037729 [Zingiber officinale]
MVQTDAPIIFIRVKFQLYFGATCECMLLMISVPFVVVVWGSGKIAGLCQAFNDILDDLTMYLWLLNLTMGLINNDLSGVMVSLMRVQVTCKTSQVSLDEGLGDRHRLAQACVIGYGLGMKICFHSCAVDETCGLMRVQARSTKACAYGLGGVVEG